MEKSFLIQIIYTVIPCKPDGKAVAGPFNAVKMKLQCYYKPAPPVSPDVLLFLDGGCPLALPPLARRLVPPPPPLLDNLLVVVVVDVAPNVAAVTSLGFLGTGGPSPGITMPHCFANINWTSEKKQVQ